MKAMSCLIMAAIMVMACGGDDVTGPGTSEPDTTEEWEHTVLLQTQILGDEPYQLSGMWLEDGEICGYDTLTTLWEHELEGSPGDSLWFSGCVWNEAVYTWLTIYVDGEQVTSSAPPTTGYIELSYVIP
jgi:hypothetical protein